MSTTQLSQIKAKLIRGDRYKLAVALGVTPAKIQLALDGLVKSDEFMHRFNSAVDELISTRQGVAN